MACETSKEIWEKLREDYEGNQRVKNVKLFTLKREFEMHKMKKGETVNEYVGKLMEIVNKIKLLSEPFPDSKIVEKILISLPARFEPKISAIEESCDLTRLTVAELISKLHAQEQRTSLRDDETVKGAFQARKKSRHQGKGNKNGGAEKGKATNTSKDHGKKKEFPPCNILPTKAVEGKTPVKAWSGLKPLAKHLKIFGSICYVYVPTVKRTKLDQKADQGIFLGYAAASKGYRVYNLRTNQVQVSRDIKVDENAHWNWEYQRIAIDTTQNQIQTQSSSDSDPAPDVNDDANSVTSLDSPVGFP
ncbi:hypothetical protein F0562_020944 [Nyssa sinensis]|uniref:Retroviral polymerase SH3-like domain-containing protein n=1 Tax=Nyssa sinensis TaxID=561372 RepID=A0A5J5BX38_9ASTE|nr:hypothetical protein F0562_020944 [Nyssa sinensis]